MNKKDVLRDLDQIETLIDNMEIVGRSSRLYQLEAFKILEKLIDRISNEGIEEEKPIQPSHNQLPLL